MHDKARKRANSGMEPSGTELGGTDLNQVEEQEQESERLWKTPNTLDAEGLAAASQETGPEDIGAERAGLESVRWEGADAETADE